MPRLNYSVRRSASILLYDETQNQLYFQSASNLETPLLRGLLVPVDASIAGWILTERQPLIISDTQQDPRHFDKIAKATNVETRSLIGVPLVHKNKVIGVLESINKHNGNFNQEDLEILDALGAQAAVAIENSRLFQQSDLISELAHELRTPLGSLNAASYLLLRQEISQEQRISIINTLIQETHRLSEMVSSFLDFARLEFGRVRYTVSEIQISPLLSDCLAIMSSKLTEKHHTLETDLTENLPEVTGDPDKLKQVFINLISNAIKYTPDGGTLRISTAVSENTVEVRLQDNGPGISADNLPRLFERFYRVPGTEGKIQGTGLGLSISKRIIDAHQGNIKISSVVGEGTTVLVKLPVASTSNSTAS